MEKTIFYIGNFKVGLMDAQAQLVMGNCRIFRELGYHVVLIGNDHSIAAPGKRLVDTKTDVQGFETYNIPFTKGLGDLVNIIQIHCQIISIISKYPDVAMLISYGSPTFAIQLSWLVSWCKRHNIAIVSTCVDLSNLSHGTLLERFIKTIDWKWREYIYQYRVDGIIAVSSYIAQYHQKGKKKEVIVVPPLKDTKEVLPPSTKSNDIISLVYIGIPFPIDGRKVDIQAYKDRIDLFIQMLCDVRTKVPAFRFDIYGLTKSQYLQVVKEHENLLLENSDIVFFHGRIMHDKAMEVVRNADYSVLYRSINEMTMAGFSSKLVESISCGTPMIMTDTSDYTSYLQNGVHCHLLDSNDISSSTKKLINILNNSKGSIAAMKIACYESHMFDYRIHIDRIKEFTFLILNKGIKVKRYLPKKKNTSLE